MYVCVCVVKGRGVWLCVERMNDGACVLLASTHILRIIHYMQTTLATPLAPCGTANILIPPSPLLPVSGTWAFGWLASISTRVNAARQRGNAGPRARVNEASLVEGVVRPSPVVRYGHA